MNPPNIVIVDYGMGNLFNIQRAIAFLGREALISSDPSVIGSAEKLILPGVGAFGAAMGELERLGLLDPLRKFAESRRPLLGICLGMQLLFSKSFEFGEHGGLGLIPGKVVRFRRSEVEDIDLKIPQIGWNSIERPARLAEGPGGSGRLLAGVAPGAHFYFVHSFFCDPDDPAAILAETRYGRDRFCSVVNLGNLWGCQFHPERSGDDGLTFLNNFIGL